MNTSKPESDSSVQFSAILLNPILDKEELNSIRNIPYVSEVNFILSQIAELIKISNPDTSYKEEELNRLSKLFYQENGEEDYGLIVYYPWKNLLTRILPKEDFYKVRTARNVYKITPEEQKILSQKVIGVVGLSVGQSVAVTLALECAFEEIRLADFDFIELSNLNRLRGGIPSLGVNKSILAAREIAEIDPFLKVRIFRDGITQENVEDFLIGKRKLDVLFDECDSLDIKILLRERARNHGIPVLMDTSDRGMFDIERFDLDSSLKLFHGLAGDLDTGLLKGLTNEEKIPFILKMIGSDTLSPRMKSSLLEVQQTLSSWPQLASSVFLGGAIGAYVAKEVLLKKSIKSGRFFIDFDEIFYPDMEAFKLIEGTGNDSLIDLNQLKSYTSNLILANDTIERIVEKANLAPSGGNCQPWKWVYDSTTGVLHLLHDKKRSESLLDYKGMGSLIAFGSAFENVRLICSELKIFPELKYFMSDFEQDHICSIGFDHAKETYQFAYLSKGMDSRITNRKNSERTHLSTDELDSLNSFIRSLDQEFCFVEDQETIDKLSDVICGMDRIRILNEIGHKNFLDEIRWDQTENLQKRDGIDIPSLELENKDISALSLLKDDKAVEFLRSEKLGFGLTKISEKTVKTSSAICLLNAQSFTPDSYFNLGRNLQKVWIYLNENGICVQPISASLFLYQRLFREVKSSFSDYEQVMIKKYASSFFETLKLREDQIPGFVIRLNKVGEVSSRSLRRELIDTLTII